MKKFRLTGMLFRNPEILPNVPYLGIGHYYGDGEPESGFVASPLNDNGDPLCPNGKPLAKWGEDAAENNRLIEPLYNYVGERFDERLKMMYDDKHLNGFVYINQKQAYAIYHHDLTPIDGKAFHQAWTMYGRCQGKIPIYTERSNRYGEQR